MLYNIQKIFKEKLGEKKIREYLFIVFENCFCYKKQGEQEKHKEHICFPFFFCYEKHGEHIKH